MSLDQILELNEKTDADGPRKTEKEKAGMCACFTGYRGKMEPA